jgi:hypothetical protein
VQVSDSEASPGYPQCPSVPVSQLWGIGKGARGRGADDEGAEQKTASRDMPGVWALDPAAVVMSRFAWPSGGLRGCTGGASTAQLVHCFWKPVSLGRWSLFDGACWPKKREANQVGVGHGGWPSRARLQQRSASPHHGAAASRGEMQLQAEESEGSMTGSICGVGGVGGVSVSA